MTQSILGPLAIFGDEGVVYGNGYLAGDLGKETDVLWTKDIRSSSKTHKAENAVSVDEWQETAGLHTLGQSRGSRGVSRQVVGHKELARSEHSSRERAFEGNESLLFKNPLLSGKSSA
jgi:hypothetical protein